MNAEPESCRSSDPSGSMDYVNRDNSWHLDKRLNVSHLVATATLIAGLFMWSGKIDTRIALVEQSQSQAQTAQRLIDVRQDDDMRAAVLSVKSEMRDINSKLDRLIEGKR